MAPLIIRFLKLNGVVKPVRFAPLPLNDVAVTTPVTTAPFGKVGAPVPDLFTILSTSNLPAPPAPVVPFQPNPSMSGIKSSPSATIKSALSST